MKVLFYFNKILNYVLLFSFLLPIPLSVIKCENYFSLLFKISIPIFVIFYSLFWILINRKLDDTKRNIEISKNNLNKFEGRESLLPGGLQEYYKRKESLENNLNKLEDYLKHVNYSLRIFVIIASFISILNTIFL